MYQISLINTVRSWERNLEIESQQPHHERERFSQPVSKNFSTGVQPVAEGEVTMYHTSLINAVQVWKRRLEAEEDQRNQRKRMAETVHATIFRRLPRLKLGRCKELIHKAELVSCCHARADCQDALNS